MPIVPDFLIAGAQKSGSSWLADNLGRHPRLFIPKKELLYFNVPANYARGPDWYAGHFARARPGMLIGEKTPDYLTVYQGSGEERPMDAWIQAMNPAMRLLFVLRNPVDRTLSALLHHIWFRRFPADADPEDLLFGRYAATTEKWNVLANGFYGRNLTRFLDRFGPEQVRVWIFERDVCDRPAEMLHEAAAFIGVDGAAAPEPSRGRNTNVRSRLFLRANQSAPWLGALWQGFDRQMPGLERVRLSPALRQRLQDLFAEDVGRVEALIGRPLPEWRR